MLDFLTTLFTTPGSSDNAYEWGAAFGTHAGFGVCAFAILTAFMSPLRAAILPALVYLFLWEGAQVWFAGTSVLLDGLLDSTAFTFGALLGYAIWQHETNRIRLFLLGLFVVALSGLRKRL